MTNFLLKSGMVLMLIAGVFIITAFFIFVAFSLVMLAPGLLLYNAGMKSIYNNVMRADNIKTIDVTDSNSDNEFVAKGKAIMKSAIRKIRNFLSKYAD